MKPVKQIDIKRNIKVKELIHQFKQSGVMGAGRIAEAASLSQIMRKEKKQGLKVFFGLAGAMVPGGMKNIIIDMLKSGFIDVFVTTGANLTHDLVESLGHRHYQGSSEANDVELFKKGLDRMYDSYMPNRVYEDIEVLLEKNFDTFKDCNGIKDFLWKLGGLLPKKHPSILRTCYEKNIPVFCPALADSGIGLVIWGQLARGKKIDVKAFDDLKDMMNLAWDAKKAGVFYIGGGVPKNFIQQAMQLSPKSASYGIQITTDRPEYGGSSGAPLKEGISWGKMNPKAHFIDVYCDATIALPLIWGAIK